MKEKRPKISLILPAYNVERWLPKCIETIEKQTYKDFEVIAIDDGSSDETGELLNDWAERDERIIVIHKNNEGVFLARNEGVKISRGEYLSFIDADDWIESTFLEKLLNAIEINNADVSECDFWRFNNKTGEKTCRRTYGYFGINYTPNEHMLYAPSMLWKCLFRKSFWQNNNIYIPNCLGSAHVVYVLLFILGAKWINVHEPLYYYRRMRAGSIVDLNGKNTNEQYRMGLDELNALQMELEKRGLFDSHREDYRRIVYYRLSDMLAAQYTRLDEMELEKQVKEYYDYISIIDNEIQTYFVLGGYNLNRISSYLPMLNNPKYRYNFSSLISIMSPINGISISHHNKYREKMIRKDIESKMLVDIKEVKPKYIILDLIDERFDVIKYGEGYITKSDALLESNFVINEAEIVQWMSDEYISLFKRAVKAISEICMENKIKLVLVENYLCTQYGSIDDLKTYNEQDYICNINKLLKELYQIMYGLVPDIIQIKTSSENYYTDDEYEYGVQPWHINEGKNMHIADEMWEIIKCLEK